MTLNRMFTYIEENLILRFEIFLGDLQRFTICKVYIINENYPRQSCIHTVADTKWISTDKKYNSLNCITATILADGKFLNFELLNVFELYIGIGIIHCALIWIIDVFELFIGMWIIYWCMNFNYWILYLNYLLHVN